MEYFWYDILKLFLQILFLLGAALVAIWFYLRQGKQDSGIDDTLSHDPLSVNKNDALFFSLKLQACERLILFLERISLNQLVLRLLVPGMTVAQLQQLMIKTIREEFDYNLSQRLYVSASTWEKIRHVREDSIRVIDLSAAKFEGRSDARDFASALVQENLSEGKPPLQAALESVRREPENFKM